MFIMMSDDVYHAKRIYITFKTLLVDEPSFKINSEEHQNKNKPDVMCNNIFYTTSFSSNPEAAVVVCTPSSCLHGSSGFLLQCKDTQLG